METTTISCPYYNSDTLVILDGVDGEIDLVSDCENCCRPINLRATVECGEVVGLMLNEHAFHLFQKPVKQ
ncbi:MAG: hypothetical protein CBC62_00245 [Opitutia bacterium TMED102]|nr:MAG: hypothetical protein CBC62_00245 [Opitutae bacterium TMED102]